MRKRDRKHHGQPQARIAAPTGGPRVGNPAPATTPVLSPAPGMLATLGLCPPPLDEPEELKPLDDHWCQWITDQSLARRPHAEMMAELVRANVDPAQASGFIAALPRNPMYRTAERLRDKYERFARVMRNVQSVRETDPAYDKVEKRANLSREEFLERYVRGNRPVVITDIARDWPAMRKWSFAEFKRRYGAMTVQVQAGREADRDFEVNKVKHIHHTNFAAFLDRLVNSGVTNDEYLTANNQLLRKPEFAGLFDDIGPLPDYCDANLRNCASLWVGPQGTRTPLHHDTLMLLHTQIVGRKRWRFVSPLSGPRVYNDFDVYSPVDYEEFDAQRFPDAADLKVLDVVVEPGETVFLPLAWWHQVTSLDKCISLSFTNIDVPNRFDFGNGH